MTGSKKILHALVRHRAVVLGAILISLVWMAVFFFLKNEHDSAERAAIQNSTNLAGAFEEHLSRSLIEIDRSLKIMRALYVRDPGKFDLVDWLKGSRILTDDVLQIAIVGRDGTVKLSTSSKDNLELPDYRVSDYYMAHVDAVTDHLVIGKPTIDGATEQWVLQLSRRIEASNGSFDGVIVATVDPIYLTRIYNSVSIGENGYIRVIGRDGAVRATSGQSFSLLGKDFSGADLLKKVSVQSDGWFYTNSVLSDHLRRLIAYRSVKDYPLIITVGLATDEIFARLDAQQRTGFLAAAILSLLILIVTAFSVRGHVLRDAEKSVWSGPGKIDRSVVENDACHSHAGQRRQRCRIRRTIQKAEAGNRAIPHSILSPARARNKNSTKIKLSAWIRTASVPPVGRPSFRRSFQTPSRPSGRYRRDS